MAKDEFDREIEDEDQQPVGRVPGRHAGNGSDVLAPESRPMTDVGVDADRGTRDEGVDV
jgi:hypothetical protein